MGPGRPQLPQGFTAGKGAQKQPAGAQKPPPGEKRIRQAIDKGRLHQQHDQIKTALRKGRRARINHAFMPPARRPRPGSGENHLSHIAGAFQKQDPVRRRHGAQERPVKLPPCCRKACDDFLKRMPVQKIRHRRIAGKGKTGITLREKSCVKQGRHRLFRPPSPVLPAVAV